MSCENMVALHRLDAEIDIHHKKYVSAGKANQEIATVRDGTIYKHKEIIRETFKKERRIHSKCHFIKLPSPFYLNLITEWFSSRAEN